MVEKLHHVVLVGGEIGFGKTTTLQHVIDEVSSVNVIGFVQPSVYDQKQSEQVDQEKSSEHSQQIKIINIEQHRKAIEIHFLSKFRSSHNGNEKRIFTLATLNPDFMQEDTVSIMSENMKAKKPKQPRWIFNNEVFGQISQLLEEKMQSLMNENNTTSDKTLIVIDELGWLEMEGKGHWPLVSKLVSQYSNSNIVWMFAVRNTLLKDHQEKVYNLFKENGCTAQIHPFELFKTDSSQRIADNFEEVVSSISLIVK